MRRPAHAGRAMIPGGFVVTRYDRATGATTNASLPISPAHYYTMHNLQIAAPIWYSKKIARGGLVPGDVVYVQYTGASRAHQCVVVTRVTACQVHTAAIEGSARFFFEQVGDGLNRGPGAPERMETWLTLAWTADPARRTDETCIFRWSDARDAYVHELCRLVYAGETKMRCQKVDS